MNISVHYGRLAAVRGVSLSVGRGEIVCLVGPNGAGKSTTLLTIAGVLAPTQGTVIFDGSPTAGLSPEVVARLGISMVPEGRRVFSSLTVEEKSAPRHIRPQRQARRRERIGANL